MNLKAEPAYNKWRKRIVIAEKAIKDAKKWEERLNLCTEAKEDSVKNGIGWVVSKDWNEAWKRRRKAPVPLVWTKDKPAKPGRYWRNVAGTIWVCEVGFNDSGELCEIKLNDVKFPLWQCSGEWAGPIPEPIGFDDIRPGERVEIAGVRLRCKTWKGETGMLRHGATCPPAYCCREWKGKTFRRYFCLQPNGEVPHTDNKFTFCPECGKRL